MAKKRLAVGSLVAVFTALVLLMSSVHVGALPNNESAEYWYDEGGGLVYESWRFCDGSRFTSGNQSLAVPGTMQHFSTSCQNPGPTTHCFYQVIWDGSLYLEGCV
jgi:hypothetical protein